MTNFNALVTLSSESNQYSIVLNFDNIEEYSDKYDELDVDNVMSVEFELSNDSNLESNERHFLKAMDISYNVLVSFEAGEYDDIINDYKSMIAFEYLIDNGQDGEYAAENYESVQLFKGSLLDYVDQYMNEVYDIPASLLSYFNFQDFGDDLVVGGEIVDLDNGYFVTNGNEF